MKQKPTARRGPPRAFGVLSAKDAIGRALRLRGISDEVRGERVVTEWSELVGPKIALRTRPDGISDRVLWVEVATSAWMHELTMLKPQLVRGLIDRLGEPRLFDDLRFKLAGRQRKEPGAARPRATPAAPRRAAVVFPASGAARERIVNEVAAIDDAELRELIARVRITNDR